MFYILKHRQELMFLYIVPPITYFTQELLCKVKRKASSELCFQGIELKFKDFFDRDTEGEDKGIPFNIYKYPFTNFSEKKKSVAFSLQNQLVIMKIKTIKMLHFYYITSYELWNLEHKGNY